MTCQKRDTFNLCYFPKRSNSFYLIPSGLSSFTCFMNQFFYIFFPRATKFQLNLHCTVCIFYLYMSFLCRYFGIMYKNIFNGNKYLPYRSFLLNSLLLWRALTNTPCFCSLFINTWQKWKYGGTLVSKPMQMVIWKKNSERYWSKILILVQRLSCIFRENIIKMVLAFYFYWSKNFLYA